MAKAKRRGQARHRLSLSVRLSLLVLFAALLPLAAVVGINDYFSRGTLIDQNRQALTTDASSKVSLLDTYLHERELDGSALASLITAPAYVACAAPTELPPQVAAALAPQLDCAGTSGTGTTGLPFYKGSNERALKVGLVRDSNYTVWSIYAGTGKLLLTQSAPGVSATASTTVPKEDLVQVMKQGKQYISPVYYDAKSNHAYVHIYSPIALPTPQATITLGFLDATLNIDYIWNQVNKDSAANGTGSYAFITDENGVRIADGHSSDLFTSVAPLDAATQQAISGEQRFGTSDPVKVDNLGDVASSLKSTTATDSFQGVAAPGSSIQYQFVRIHMANVPWTYFVLSPLSTVTQIANDQIRISLISAGIIAVLAILIGLLIGTRTTRPVQAATGELEGAAVSLKLLASRQESSASEQQWVVDACRTGLDSVRYLSDAMNQAARRIIDASNWFSEYWDRLTEEQAKRTVTHLLELARYIDEGARRQQASSERLGKAITVTMQVSDQLVAGATAATNSAEQLEQVVLNLEHIVGGRVSDSSVEAMQMKPERPPMEPMTSLGAQDYRGPGSARIDMPAQRQLPAPVESPEMWQRAPRAPQAPFSIPGGRRSDDSQAYFGEYGGGGYGDEAVPEQWANARPGMPGNRPSQFWNDR